jgi:hypothetical protein
VNSVVSYGKDGFPEMQFGSYFGPVALEVYELIAETDFPEPPELELESFGTSITMKLKKHLKASGTVSSSSPACAANAPVIIGKVKGNTANAVAQTLSKASGKYSVKVPDKKGLYVAFALESYRDSFTLCGESQSQVLKHKH